MRWSPNCPRTTSRWAAEAAAWVAWATWTCDIPRQRNIIPAQAGNQRRKKLQQKSPASAGLFHGAPGSAHVPGGGVLCTPGNESWPNGKVGVGAITDGCKSRLQGKSVEGVASLRETRAAKIPA